MAKAMAFQPNQITPPRWAGDFITPDRLIPGGAKFDPAALPGSVPVTVVVGAAGAALGALAVPVAALTGPIPAGTVLDFGGTKKATLTALAATGAVSLVVSALPAALVSGNTAYYPGENLWLPSGTLVGRTYAQRDAKAPFHLAADTDEEIYLVAFERDAEHLDGANLMDIELYRHLNVVKENYLPGYTTGLANLSATLKTFLRANYACTIGWE